jgi:peptide/nickel transport system permease protein
VATDVTYLSLRLAWTVVVVVVVTAASWLLLHVLRPELLAGEPLLPALLDYLERAFLHLDLGRSTDRGARPVIELVREGIAADLWLLAGGLALGLAAGIAGGLYCAAHPRGALARVLEVLAALAVCAPVYVVGLGLLLLVGDEIAGLGLEVVPLAYVPFAEDPLRWLGSLVTPWVVLGLPLAGLCLRGMRGTTREMLEEDYVRTARAKGVARAAVLRRHAAPAALPGVLGLAGATMNHVMLTNLVLVERVFGIPGAFEGSLRAVEAGDFPVLFALVILATAFVALASLVVDLALAWIDPRVRAAA